MTTELPAGVVVGVDGAPDGLRAAEWAAREAVRLAVPVLVANVREHTDLVLPADARAVLDADAERYVEEAVAAARTAAPDVTIHRLLLDGDAADRLIALAADATVVVVGARGRGGFVRLTLGSVADEVSRTARAPGVVVRDAGEQSGPVAVAVDPDDDPGPLLDFAFAQAAAGPGALSAHHSIAVPPGVLPPFELPGTGDRQRLPAEERVALALAPWRGRYPTVSVAVSVRIGSPAAHLVETSARSSLLVVGGRGRPARRMLGAVTTQVARHASCPVAVVGPGDPGAATA